MIYPSYGLILPDNVQDFVSVLEMLNKIHIKNNITSFRTFWVDGAKQEIILGEAPQNIPRFGWKEFILQYESFYDQMINYIENLCIGDRVYIEEARGDEDGKDYPYQFAPEMQDLAGQAFTITGVSYCDYSDSLRFGNRNKKCFYLDGDADGYTWHSSMFSLVPVEPVQHIDVSPLIINPLEL